MSGLAWFVPGCDELFQNIRHMMDRYVFLLY